MNFASLDYSTDEQDTGIEWVDGKTIYKKTVYVGTLPNNTTKNVNHGVSNLDTVVDYQAIAHDSGGVYIRLPHVATNQLYEIQMTVSLTQIRIATSNDRSSYGNCYATIFYTKN